MPLHLLKLCVGADSIADLESRIEERLSERRRRKEPREHWHVTRMAPKRADELLDGGSLYWIIKGQVSARQRILRIEPFTDREGVGRCKLRLDPPVVPVRPRPHRPFQGWRYLSAADAPPDLAAESRALGAMPEGLRRELADLGLL